MKKAEKAAAARRCHNAYVFSRGVYEGKVQRRDGRAGEWATQAMYWAFLTLFYGGEL